MEKRGAFKAFWQLFRGYWNSEHKWKARGLLAFVIGLNFFGVYLLVRLNSWYNEFYNALQQYQADQFWPLVGEFTAIAMLYIVIAVYAIYLRQEVQIKWRTWLTDQYLSRWLSGQVYYRLQVQNSDTDNPDQRISEDINQFVNLSLQLLIGFLKQLTTLAAFGVVLWNLSGAFTMNLGGHDFVIYGYMFWFSLFYSGIGTVCAHFVGRKLIGLNFDQQRFEADFRFNMMRVRENSESIAFYGGEKAENKGFHERFAKVISNFWQLMKQTKLLNFYVNGYAQLAVIVPLILAAPQYFAGGIALGGLMQTVSAFGRVQDALSYFVESYDTIAQLAAVVKRLATFTEHMEGAEGVDAGIVRREEGQQLAMEDLQVQLPDSRVLLENCTLSLPAGSRLLVTGSSGCGKSTLLRTLAGIWPYGKGKLSLKAGSRLLFLPQRPYLPLGSLRRALYYPGTAAGSDETMQAVLQKVGLEEFVGRLDEIDDWSRILSLGEQQRLAFARVLLAKPDWVFLDEATSALDEPREAEMYQMLAKELPDMGVVSVGHRSTLFAQHQQELKLAGDGSWEVRAISL
ncbi:putative ABC transporter ATP-binding protein [Selenomonas ruminantium subsp. lactilytica TAM6421]|uniref:Putative ABC transporter ATP-binding protein n=1 Tax=Selenomonas ruminantium subsp. lactilytica (strain NBRC 103574 / TAM6421) TaxID=927704 RepID=I0GMX0_SELRL|nr:ABC transporter ATP-binding protein/permease [Selenomonas ruminantium]BAL82107.1 putative ABC transporter ATP-binding protein [Selenomonas ruminantium subsp. lactilytica TAM6421]